MSDPRPYTAAEIQSLREERDEARRESEAAERRVEELEQRLKNEASISNSYFVTIREHQEANESLRSLVEQCEKALEKIAKHPACDYEKAGPGQYGQGIADGHRLARSIAESALASIREMRERDGARNEAVSGESAVSGGVGDRDNAPQVDGPTEGVQPAQAATVPHPASSAERPRRLRTPLTTQSSVLGEGDTLVRTRPSREGRLGGRRAGGYPHMSRPRTEKQERCCSLLSDVFGGAHHVQWSRVKYEVFEQVSYCTHADLATWDGSLLTRLVVGAHRDRVRVEIMPGGPGRVKLWLSARQEDGAMHERHPGCDHLAKLAATPTEEAR